MIVPNSSNWELVGCHNTTTWYDCYTPIGNLTMSFAQYSERNQVIFSNPVVGIFYAVQVNPINNKL